MEWPHLLTQIILRQILHATKRHYQQQGQQWNNNENRLLTDLICSPAVLSWDEH